MGTLTERPGGWGYEMRRRLVLAMTGAAIALVALGGVARAAGHQDSCVVTINGTVCVGAQPTRGLPVAEAVRLDRRYESHWLHVPMRVLRVRCRLGRHGDACRVRACVVVNYVIRENRYFPGPHLWLAYTVMVRLQPWGVVFDAQPDSTVTGTACPTA